MSILNPEQLDVISSITNDMKNSHLTFDEYMKRFDRYKKYGVQNQKNDPVMPNPDAKFLPDTIYVYGLDYMDNENVKEYFGKYKFFAVNWLNDSSCIFDFRLNDKAL